MTTNGTNGTTSKSLTAWLQIVISVGAVIVSVGASLIAGAQQRGVNEERTNDNTRRLNDIEPHVRRTELMVERMAGSMHVEIRDLK